MMTILSHAPGCNDVDLMGADCGYDTGSGRSWEDHS